MKWLSLTMMLIPLHSGLKVLPAPVEHASPLVMVFAGDVLPERVVIRGMKPSEELLSALTPVTVVPSDTAGRRSLDVGMYYLRSLSWTERPREQIPLAMADERFWYYPVRAHRPALLVSRLSVSGYGRQQPSGAITGKGLELLRRHGLPVEDERP